MTYAPVLPRLLEIVEEQTLDPLENLAREELYLRTASVPSFRVWASSDSVVLGRFLEEREEVRSRLAARVRVPVLRRRSGGGAVFHDPGNLNYSIYIPPGFPRPFAADDSLRFFSWPVARLLDHLGLDWSFVPPNSIFARGAKVSGSAQWRSCGRLLHHGTLLVASDLDKLRRLLKPGGRSDYAPVANLSELVGGVSVARAAGLLRRFCKHGVRPLELHKIQLKGSDPMFEL